MLHVNTSMMPPGGSVRQTMAASILLPGILWGQEEESRESMTQTGSRQTPLITPARTATVTANVQIEGRGRATRKRNSRQRFGLSLEW